MNERADLSDQITRGRVTIAAGGTLPVVRLLVAGDLCPIGRPEGELSGEAPRAFWGRIPEVTAAHDFSIANLECPLTVSRAAIAKVGPHLRADPVCALGIRAGGFDVVTLANNHILDMGEQGLLDTLRACGRAGLKTVGAGANLVEATRPLMVEVNSTKVAILALAEHEFSIAGRTTAGAWPLDPVDNYHQVTHTSQDADFALVVLHAGNEMHPFPSPSLVRTCRYLVHLGAAAVVCHHSHVPSGVEVFEGKPIIYGTGNLLFEWPRATAPEWHTGYMVGLELQGGMVSSVSLIPYIQGCGTPFIRLLEGDEARTALRGVAKISATIQDDAALDETWRRFCQSKRPEYIARLASSSWLEEYLRRRGLLRLGSMRKRIPHLLNLVRCQAHRQVLIQVLLDAMGE